MKDLGYEQLSLIAGEVFDCPPSTDWAIDTCHPSTDWAIDTCPPLDDRSHEQIRRQFVERARGGQLKNPPPCDIAPHDGGQPQTRMMPMRGNAGQTSPTNAGQTKNPLTIPTEGDPGTWTEIQNRQGGSYKYLRWREFPSGKKRSKYICKL